MKWEEVRPHPEIVAALDHAGDPPLDGDQNEKRRWSERFADGCAIAIAKALRQTDLAKKKNIRPVSLDDGTEPFTPLGGGASKRIDVTVVDPMLGLEIGVSLKGLNFRDSAGNQFDKNLTGRLYELGDEVRLIHEFLPNALMVGIFFLPLDSCSDKRSEKSPSSFASAVLKLRARSGRIDAAVTAHSSKCDLAFVGLYARGEEAESFSRGAVRFFDVERDPPRRGRPKIMDTIGLEEMVARVVAVARDEVDAVWGEPEV